MLTSVHYQETTGITPIYASYRSYTTQTHFREDALTSHFYSLIPGGGKVSYEDKFRACRSHAWFVRHKETGIVRIVSDHCHLRWCPWCSKIKAFVIFPSVASWVSRSSDPKLLTVTLRDGSHPLSVQIDRIYDSFRQLRKRMQFKHHVRGGLWFFQVTVSRHNGHWHPHIHALIEGKYFPHHKLKSLWESITTDSYIVDIRAVRRARGAIKDVVRYIARPMSLKGLNDDQMRELHDSFHGRRLCGTFGTARSVSFKTEKFYNDDEWEKVGSWDTVVNMQHHDLNAACILDCFLRNEPLDPGRNVMLIENFIAGHDPPEKGSVYAGGRS